MQKKCVDTPGVPDQVAAAPGGVHRGGGDEEEEAEDEWSRQERQPCGRCNAAMHT